MPNWLLVLLLAYVLIGLAFAVFSWCKVVNRVAPGWLRVALAALLGAAWLPLLIFFVLMRLLLGDDI